MSWQYKDAQEYFRTSDHKLYELTQSMKFVYADSTDSSSANMSVFYNIATAIVYQLISVDSADAVYTRLLSLLNGDVSASNLLAIKDKQLRDIGLPYRKISYLRNLAQAVIDGLPDTEELKRLGDSEVVKILTSIKGVGPWTAQIYLMFTLQRPDVLPTNDFGLQTAAGKLYGLNRKMTQQELSETGKKWRPYRTIASIYLWQSRGIKHLELLKRLS